jgi:small-conductance mechanosensitive channel
MDFSILENFDIPATIEALSRATISVGGIALNPYVILKSIVVICVLLWVGSLFVRRIDRRLRRSEMRESNRVLIIKILQIMLYCLVVVVGMQVLGVSLTALSVFGGALGVGLGFGLQKIASNFISGLILLFEKSIEVGDLIELADGTVGFVRRTNARYTLLESQDGRDVLIPNEEFITRHVINWTHRDRNARSEISVSVAYDSDIALAKKLMLEAADQHPKRAKNHPSVCSISAFGDFGIQLMLHFWVEDVTSGRMEPKGEVMEKILLSFKANGISIPYPQREVRMTHINQAISEAGA